MPTTTKIRHSLKETGSDFCGFNEDGSCWQWAIAPRLTVFSLSPFFSLSLSLSFYFKSLALVVRVCTSSWHRRIRTRVSAQGRQLIYFSTSLRVSAEVQLTIRSLNALRRTTRNFSLVRRFAQTLFHLLLFRLLLRLLLFHSPLFCLRPRSLPLRVLHSFSAMPAEMVSSVSRM